MASPDITTVGEFHYLHHAPDGRPYADPLELALRVIAAARDVGLRIALLRVGYARPGFSTLPQPRQRRFYDPDPDALPRRRGRAPGTRPSRPPRHGRRWPPQRARRPPLLARGGRSRPAAASSTCTSPSSPRRWRPAWPSTAAVPSSSFDETGPPRRRLHRRARGPPRPARRSRSSAARRSAPAPSPSATWATASSRPMRLAAAGATLCIGTDSQSRDRPLRASCAPSRATSA